jgi:hypothetical protein
MEAVCSSKILAYNQKITWWNNPEDYDLTSHCCENFKSYICNLCFLLTVDHVSQPYKTNGKITALCIRGGATQAAEALSHVMMLLQLQKFHSI